MKQPHTEQDIRHTDDQQNTGNHKKPDTPASNVDSKGGTRAGADNVEPAKAPIGKGETLDESGATSE